MEAPLTDAHALVDRLFARNRGGRSPR